MESYWNYLSLKEFKSNHLSMAIAIFIVNKSIKEDIDRVKKEIKKHKSTYGWQLFECETEECRRNVVKAFLKHLFNI